MYARHHVGTTQAQDVIITLEVLAMIRESLSAVICLGEFLRLDHGAHGPIDHQNALLKGGGEEGGSATAHDRYLAIGKRRILAELHIYIKII